MTKQELVSDVSAISGHPKSTVEAVINLTLDSIKEAVKKGDKVTLKGFATIDLKTRAARPARNLATGETMMVPETKVPVFKASKEFKMSLN